MMMATRPTTTTFAFGSSTAIKQPISSFKNHHQIKKASTTSSSSSSSSSSQEQKKEAVKELTTSCGRRDAITNFGVYLAAATLFSQSQNSQASTVDYTAHYVGKLENGKVFDSSYNRGKPLSFRVGVGEVIKGWDQGILGGDGIPPMLPGGKRSLKLPSDLAYGMRGAGCKGGTNTYVVVRSGAGNQRTHIYDFAGTNCIIPPNSTLLFDVEFIGKA
ncbi:hypothetical protein C5167_040144 [Papaver somniferum]|uniref:peptidylprolyl isomerase n=1 Tax=Papaver somniferum TaxID=3469 RepID=A0A4Y7IE02_PAPSO|nr:hypothetical protein C5167_040144 [Papaver somniferum]